MSKPVVMVWFQNEWVPPPTNENTAAGYYGDTGQPNKVGGDDE